MSRTKKKIFLTRELTAGGFSRNSGQSQILCRPVAYVMHQRGKILRAK